MHESLFILFYFSSGCQAIVDLLIGHLQIDRNTTTVPEKYKQNVDVLSSVSWSGSYSSQRASFETSKILLVFSGSCISLNPQLFCYRRYLYLHRMFETYARILKAHSHSMSGGSIWASLECQFCFWKAGRWVVT
jgi:hypothetical protein